MSTDRILSQILGSGAASGFAGGLAGGLASSLLTSKAGRKVGKKALKVGGIAALGGLAYAAWTKRGSGAAIAPPPPTLSQPGPVDVEEHGCVLLQAMIAAAHADGRLDPKEWEAIRGRIDELELSPAERSLLMQQIENPVGITELVAAARTPAQAGEIYAASLLAIDVDTPAERAYLDMLAARLGLPADWVDALHAEAGVAARGGGPELRVAS
ncbi:MAG: tellurite resistance TerB family protein [Myxococcota bacterium]|nr:tellurite resistance TerB family protein [Myxococcota bacterium]